MKNRIKLATAGLRISAILYYLIIAFCVAGAIFLKEPEGDLSPGMLWFLAAFTAPFVVFLEVLIVHVRRRRYWAWVAGIVVGGLYASSLFMPLGVMILIGLLSEESRASFGVGACSPGGPPCTAQGRVRQAGRIAVAILRINHRPHTHASNRIVPTKV